VTVPHGASAFPPTDPQWGIAFFYGTLSCAWVHWPVPVERVAPLLRGTGFKPALFDGKALVNMNFQAYTATATYGLEMTNEVELNIVVYPEARERSVPDIPLDLYLLGMDQTKTIGNYRLAVSCDDLVAIYFGRKVFGENKYPGTFKYTIPNVNGQARTDPGLAVWDVHAYDSSTPIPLRSPLVAPPPPPIQAGTEICHLVIDLSKLVGRVAAPSPFVRYSQWPADPPPDDDPGAQKERNHRRPAASRWNVLGPHQHYALEQAGASAVALDVGASAAPLGVALRDLRLATTAAVAVTTFQYQPAAIEGRPYFADLP
jgi:hypothetical protein